MIDKQVESSTLFETKDYKKFKLLKGNRSIDMRHVKDLARRMERDGNLTNLFPMQVNENFEIVDGQHRLEACKSLGYSICYEVKIGTNLRTVRALNSGSKNWTWLDCTESYAALGNVNYMQFSQLVKDFKGLSFTVLMAYATGRTGGVSNRAGNYGNGEFIMAHYEQTRTWLELYKEISDLADHNTRNFAIAFLKFIRRPNYDQSQMSSNMLTYGELLTTRYYIDDYYEALEEIYNA